MNNSKWEIADVVLGVAALAVIAGGIVYAVQGGTLTAESPLPPGATISNQIEPDATSKALPSSASSASSEAPSPDARSLSWGMKFVDHDVSETDLDLMENMGITLIEGEWGMRDAYPEEILSLLDRLEAHGMKLVMNFSEESAWGYGESSAPTERPEWQAGSVVAYVKLIRNHPALFGYDISNEAGENLPNGANYRITAREMRRAADSIRAIDPSRPILVRMHYWDTYDGDFTAQNPFEDGIADIVMLNLYSNWTDKGSTPEIPYMIAESAAVLANKVRAVDPDAEIWLSLAVFREAPYFLEPSPDELARDIRASLDVNVSNISFFGWGPSEKDEKGQTWYLPRDDMQLIEVIRSYASKE